MCTFAIIYGHDENNLTDTNCLLNEQNKKKKKFVKIKTQNEEEEEEEIIA